MLRGVAFVGLRGCTCCGTVPLAVAVVFACFIWLFLAVAPDMPFNDLLVGAAF